MEKISTEIATLFHKIQEVSEDYADIKDIFFDDSSMELLEDSVSTFKLLNNSRKALVLIKFKFFLRGLNHENTDKESVKKLIDYVDNQEKAEFITNSFDKILTSNSKLSCCLMGLILNDMVKQKRDVSQEDLIILQVLSVLNDFDIKNLFYLFEIVLRKNTRNHIVADKDISECAKVCNTTTKSIRMTINILEKYNLMDKDADVSLDIDSDNFDKSSIDYDEKLYLNILSEKLYEYAKILFN